MNTKIKFYIKEAEGYGSSKSMHRTYEVIAPDVLDKFQADDFLGNGVIEYLHNLSDSGLFYDWKVTSVKIIDDSVNLTPYETTKARKPRKRNTEKYFRKSTYPNWYIPREQRNFSSKTAEEKAKPVVVKTGPNIWIDPSGKIIELDPGATAVHNRWANEYLLNENENYDDGGKYGYEILEDRGWVRYCGWGSGFWSIQKYPKGAVIRAIKDFCQSYSLDLPKEIK